MALRSRCTAILALLLCGCLSAAAREHQDPPQWAIDAAKVATPANAKNAPAVVLYRETIITFDDQFRGTEVVREAIRILKPQGRGYTHYAANYDVDAKLKYFHTWTFTETGKTLQAMDENYIDRSAYGEDVMLFTDRYRFVDPPGADPGAVVACEYQVQLRSYIHEETWDLQRDIPVVSQALEIQLPPGGHYAESWHKFAPVKPTEVGANRLRWEIHDVPGLDLENQRAIPDAYALAARMSVLWGDIGVRGTPQQWRALGTWIQQLQENRFEPTPEITAKALEITAGAPDFYTKLERITDYIQKNIRYFVIVKGIGGLQAHYAADIYRNRYGDCKDKTTLLIAMLKAVGIKAYYLHVNSERGVMDPEAPSIIGDHMITAIELPEGEHDPRLLSLSKAATGKTLVIFDPTDEITPVGVIRAELQGGYGNLANGTDSQVLLMPVLSPDSAGLVRTGTFQLALDGTLSGEIVNRYIGDDATLERGIVKETDARQFREVLERRLGAQLPGLALKDFKFDGIADLDKPLNLNLQLSAAGYSHSSGTLLLIKPRVLGARANIIPEIMQGKPRLYPIELGHPGRWRSSYDIAIPEGYAIDEVPDPVDIDLDFASYHSKVKAEPGKLHYESEYVIRNVEIPADQATAYRKLAAAILADEKGTAVLKKQ